MKQELETAFLGWRESGDLRALARVFDATSAELLAIAAHLARTRDEAEDLVQATYLAAMEGAKSFDASRALRPWLAGILAMHARKLRERRGRVEAMENVDLVGSDDPQRDAALRELASAVDRAVGELPANYAQLVRRHLVDGARSPELAREFGLSETNTRSRLHRGLKLLRRALPIGFGPGAIAAGSGRGAAELRRAVLARGAELAGVAAPAAGLSFLAIVAALLAVVGVGWAASTALPSKASHAPNELVAAIGANGLVESEWPAAAAASDSQRASVDAGDPAADPLFAALTSDVNTIRGRIAFDDGAPASGVQLRLKGWPANDELIAYYGLPENWIDPELEPTDSDGRFEFQLDAPRAFQFTLTSELDGFVPVKWRFGVLEPAEAVELGEATLEQGCMLVVRLRDATGAPLVEGWSVNVRSEAQEVGGFADVREPYFANASFDALVDGFVLSSVPRGPARVQATHRLGARIDAEADCELDVLEEVALAYDGPDLARRVAVRLSGSPVTRRFPPEVWALRLEAAGAAPRYATTLNARATGSYTFDDVDLGQYDLVLEDERYEPLRIAGVSPGEFVKLPARGAAIVKLRLVDGQGDALDPPYSFGVTWPRPNGVDSDVMLHLPHEPAPVGGVYDGMIPGLDMRFHLRVDGAPMEEIEVAALAPGEVRELVRVVDVSKRIAGRVVGADGATALEGVAVELTRGPRAGHDGEVGGSRMLNGETIGRFDRATTTDADGRFSFEALGAGQWTVRARWGDFLFADRTLDSTESGADLELAQPPHGFLVGRIQAPPSATLADHALVAWPTPGERCFSVFTEANCGELNSDGSFRVGPFPLGPRQMTLRTPPTDLNAGWQAGYSQLGTFEVLAGDSEPITIDLRESFPGSIEVALRFDGAPAREAFFYVDRIPSSPSPSATGVTVGPNGERRLNGVAPGLVRVFLRDRDETWTWRAPSLLTIPSGDTTSFEIDLATFEREVLVLDAANDQPLANFALQLLTDSWDGDFIAMRSTDANGRLRLRLPELSARFVSGRNAGDALTSSTVPWGAGETLIVLRVTLSD